MAQESNILGITRREGELWRAREANGKVLTRPALLATDGVGNTYAVDVDIGAGEILRNVPIARANREVFYAEAGCACRMRRTAGGKWEVIGFSREMPGTYTRVAVTVPQFQMGAASETTFGAVVDVSIVARPLTYGELADYESGYGTVPYGAIGIFEGGTLLEIR